MQTERVELVNPPPAEGCTDPAATNFDSAAAVLLDGACAYAVEGCVDSRAANYLPGDLQVDPLGMDSPTMRGAEILNGRVAMIAVAGMVAQELATGAKLF